MNITKHTLKPCPHWRQSPPFSATIVAEFGDCRRNRRL